MGIMVLAISCAYAYSTTYKCHHQQSIERAARYNICSIMAVGPEARYEKLLEICVKEHSAFSRGDIWEDTGSSVATSDDVYAKFLRMEIEKRRIMSRI